MNEVRGSRRSTTKQRLTAAVHINSINDNGNCMEVLKLSEIFGFFFDRAINPLLKGDATSTSKYVNKLRELTQLVSAGRMVRLLKVFIKFCFRKRQNMTGTVCFVCV